MKRHSTSPPCGHYSKNKLDGSAADFARNTCDTNSIDVGLDDSGGGTTSHQAS